MPRGEKTTDVAGTERERDDDDLAIFSDPQRIEVQFAMSIHNASQEPFSDEARFRLVLKFFYSKNDMHYFVPKEDIPDDDVEFLKDYTGENTRFFPFMMINSMSQEIINWSYANKEGKGQIYERVEMFTTMGQVRYDRYYPFVLNLVNFKIGTDKSLKCGLINLVPKPQSETNPTPALDLGVFMRDTSVFTMQEREHGKLQYEPNALHSDAYCKTIVPPPSRKYTHAVDDKVSSHHDDNHVHTRIYLCLFFEDSGMDSFVDICRFWILSMILLALLPFAYDLELGGMLETTVMLAVIDITLLWSQVDSCEFTSTERILVSHILCMLLVAAMKLAEVEGFNVFAFVIAAECVTFLFGLWEYSLFWRIVHNLKAGFYNDNKRVGDFYRISSFV